MKNELPGGSDVFIDNLESCKVYLFLDGSVVVNGKYAPPASYTAGLKDLPEGKIFHSLMYGKNMGMGSHASQLNKEERWLVTRYVQYLQNGGKMQREAVATTAAPSRTASMAFRSSRHSSAGPDPSTPETSSSAMSASNVCLSGTW